MNLIVELHVSDANPRIRADLLSELCTLLSGKGLRTSDPVPFTASADSQAVLAGLAGSSAAIRLHETE